MKSSDYYTQRNIKNLEVIDRLLQDDLPPFCLDYFMAIDSQTSTLTRLNYAHDLKIFFDYICKKRLNGKQVKQLTLLDLESITNNDIEYFLVYLSHYEYNGSYHACNERAKARKLPNFTKSQ